MAMPHHASIPPAEIGLYGASGRVSGLRTPFTFCCSKEDAVLAPSFLTEGGKGMMPGVKLWFNFLLHVLATAFVCIANAAYMINSADTFGSNLMNAMSSCAIAFQVLAVVGTLIATGCVFQAGKYPFFNAFGIACFSFAIFANAFTYHVHFVEMITKERVFTSVDGTETYAPNVEEINVSKLLTPITVLILTSRCHVFTVPNLPLFPALGLRLYYRKRVRAGQAATGGRGVVRVVTTALGASLRHPSGRPHRWQRGRSGASLRTRSCTSWGVFW